MPNADAESPKRAAGRRAGWLAAAIALFVLAFDQATKAWAVDALADGPVSIIGNDIEFRLSFNSGGAFSVFRGFTPLLAIIAVVIAFVLVRAVRRAENNWTLVSLALVLGGAVGNLSDRFFRAPSFLHGRVVDFVKLWSFPTFNVADSAITIGAVILVVSAFWPRRES